MPDTDTRLAPLPPDSSPDAPGSRASGSRGDAAMLVREMARAHGAYIHYYQTMYGLSREEAAERAGTSAFSPAEALRRIEEAPSDEATWLDFNEAMDAHPDRALAAWEAMKQEARDEHDSGARASGVLAHGSPWERARYLAVRKGFADEWGPKGSLELALIDQLALTYSAWLGWLHHFDLLAHSEVERQQKSVHQSGRYQPQRVSRQESEDRALQTADRYQRMFMRSLRALRDLRRYAPQITIHNRGQVNIGDKQVNVSE